MNKVSSPNPITLEEFRDKLKPVSYYRQARNIVSLALIDVWVSLAKWFVYYVYFENDKIDGSTTLKARRDERTKRKYLPAIEQLRREATTGPAVISALETKILTQDIQKEVTTPSFSINTDFLFPDTKKEIRNIDQYANQIAIPIVLEGGLRGRLRNHIVYLLVDRDANTIEYFDSKGLTIADSASRKIIGSDKTLETAVHEIAMAVFNEGVEFTVKENTKKTQYDTYNCGIYVANMIWRRAQRESFDKIQQNPLTLCQTRQARRDLIKTLLA